MTTRPIAIEPIAGTELRARRRALLDALAPRGLDGWIAYGDDRLFVGAEHVRYFVDFQPHFEPVLAVGDRNGDAWILTGPESVGLARRETASADVADVLAMEELVHPGLHYESVPICPGPATLRRLLGEQPRVAMLGGSLVASDLAAAVLEPLAALGTELVPADDEAVALRARKSPAEQRLLDAAFAIAAEGMVAAAEAIAPGRSERAVAAIAEGRMRSLGAEGFGIETMVAAGAEHTRTILSRTTMREIRRGDLVTVTLVPRVAGYHATLARAFVVGENPEARRGIELAWETQRAGAAALREGNLGGDVAQLCTELVRDAGCGARVDQVWVHSLGILEYEAPLFAPGSPARIGGEAAVNIDVPLFDAPWGGLRVEEGFAIEGGVTRPRLRDSEQLVPIDL